MSNLIKVLHMAPGKEPEVREIPNELEPMQKLVEGYIEVVTLGYGKDGKKVLMVCNEEGMFKFDRPAFAVKRRTHIERIFGPVFICQAIGDSFVSYDEENDKDVLALTLTAL